MFGIPDFYFRLSSYTSMSNFYIFLGIPDKFYRLLFLCAIFPYYSWNCSQFLLEWCFSMNFEIFSSLNMVSLYSISLCVSVLELKKKCWNNFSFLYEGVHNFSGIAQYQKMCDNIYIQIIMPHGYVHVGSQTHVNY